MEMTGLKRERIRKRDTAMRIATVAITRRTRISTRITSMITSISLLEFVLLGFYLAVTRWTNAYFDFVEHRKHEHKHHSSSGAHRELDLSEDEDDVPTGYGTYGKSHKPLEPNPPYSGQQPPEQDFGYRAAVATSQHHDSASYPSHYAAAPPAGMSRDPYGNYQYGSTYSDGQHHYQNPNRPPLHESEQGGYPPGGYGGPPYPADPDTGYPGYGYRYGEAS
jgi:hypothetical protein